MRKIKLRSLITALTLIFILMFIVNLVVLRVHFNVHLSDMILLVGDSPATVTNPVVQGYTAEGGSSDSGDGSARKDSFSIDDLYTESNYSFSSLTGLGDAEILINEMSLSEKITLAYIVSRIDKNDLKMLSDIFQDGITDEEITALLGYAAERLEPADVEALEEIFHRNRHIYSEFLR